MQTGWEISTNWEGNKREKNIEREKVQGKKQANV